MDYKDIIDDDTYRTDFKCKKPKENKKVSKKKIDSESESESESLETIENKEKKEDGIFSFFDLL